MTQKHDVKIKWTGTANDSYTVFCETCKFIAKDIEKKRYAVFIKKEHLKDNGNVYSA